MFLALLSHSVDAQQSYHDGYIVNSNGSKSEGQVGIDQSDFTPTLVSFKNEDSETQYQASDIDEFGFTDASGRRMRFISRSVELNTSSRDLSALQDGAIPNLETRHIFLRQLTTGKIDLYEHVSTTGISNYFIEHNRSLEQLVYVLFSRTSDGNTKVFENKKYIAQLQEITDDCPLISFTEFNNLQYSASALTDIINKYNVCDRKIRGSEFDNRRDSKFNYEFYAMYGQSQIEYEGNFPSRINLSEHFYEPLIKVGGSVSAYFNRSKLRWGGVAYFEYKPITYEHQEIHPTNNMAIEYDRQYDLKATYLSVKPMFRAALIRKPGFSVELDAGASANLLLSNTNDAMQTILVNGVPGTSEEGIAIPEFNTLDMGFATVLNINIQNLSFKAGFERTSGLLPLTYTITAPITVITAGVGYRIYRDDRFDLK